MKNVEELHLQFLNKSKSLIDGKVLQKYFINHMSKLNKLTFNIGSLVRFDNENNMPSNEDIKKTFENFNNIVILNIYYFKGEKLFGHSHPFRSIPNHSELEVNPCSREWINNGKMTHYFLKYLL
jgi:hypothetical protein